MVVIFVSHSFQFLSLMYVLGKVGWVTQLVVSLHHCRKYIATSLLQRLKDSPLFSGITAIALVSSHPAACHALSKYTSMLHFSQSMYYSFLFITQKPAFAPWAQTFASSMHVRSWRNPQWNISRISNFVAPSLRMIVPLVLSPPLSRASILTTVSPLKPWMSIKIAVDGSLGSCLTATNSSSFCPFLELDYDNA